MDEQWAMDPIAQFGTWRPWRPYRIEMGHALDASASFVSQYFNKGTFYLC